MKGYNAIYWCKVDFALPVDYLNFSVLSFPCSEKMENDFVKQ